ncbi:SAVED domain-containing protein [Bacillus megaterium]|nr:SAVED domain-containing protein [Priestia megaterium]
MKRKKSIALIHKRFGGPITGIEYKGDPPYILLDAIENQDKFEDFTEQGWENAKKVNEELYKQFEEKIRQQEADVAEVFPLSPIPLLVHLGSLLTDTVPVSVYQLDRDEGVWVSDHPLKQQEINLNFSSDVRGEDQLAVLVSVAGSVKLSYVQDVLGDKFDSVSFAIDNPDVKAVLYKQDVSYIQSNIKREVEKLFQEHDYEKVHLFYAGPAGLALEIGRGINPNIWPEVCSYQHNARNKPRYKYALTI